MKLAPVAFVALTLLTAIAIANCVPANAPDAGADTPDASAPHHYGMVNVPPVLNPGWAATTYYIDPQSSQATCADSTNTGLSSASPLCTWHELHDHVWGCGAGMGYGGQACPRIRQNVTIVFNSSQTGNGDPIYFSPMLENGAVVALQGALGTAQTTLTGTLATVTAKNRSTPTLLKSTINGADGGTSTSLSAGLLMLNTYAPTDGGATHVSRAWSYYNNSGTVSFSQPLTPVTMPLGLNGYTAEVNDWAAADTFSAYTPVSIDLVRYAPVVAHQNTTATNFAAYLYQVNVYDPTAPFWDSGVGPNTVTLNHEVSVVDSSFAKAVNVVGEAVSTVDWQNVYVGQLQAASVPSQLVFAGGVIGTQAGSYVSSLSNVLLDGDVILGGTGATYLQGTVNTAGAGAQLGLVYADTSATLGIADGVVYANGVYSSAPIVWGPGTLNVTGQSRLRYPSGSGKAAATFTLTTLQLNGQTKFCSGNPAQSATTLTCNLSLSASQLDTTLGTTIAAGCGFNPGGGGYCNGGY